MLSCAGPVGHVPLRYGPPLTGIVCTQQRAKGTPEVFMGWMDVCADPLSLPREAASDTHARLIGTGTAVPETAFDQPSVLEAFGLDDRRIRSIFLKGGIARRHLAMDLTNEIGGESQGELLSKHTRVGINLGRQAIEQCLSGLNFDVRDIDHLCCVTSTGLLVPGFSAFLVRELGLSESCFRVDVVGMGCNAGLNALRGVDAWAARNPGRLAVLVCIEVCSAMYIADPTVGNAVVNSLFGDGAAAVAVVRLSVGAEAFETAGPRLIDFSSHMMPDAIRAMRVAWDDDSGKFRFLLEPEIPYVIGANAEVALNRLMVKTGISPGEVRHWIVHSGGRKVIDAARVNLGLSRHDVRHTLTVLHDYGNLSSGSFLFSFERLMQEGVAAPGDLGVMMTMGPGCTIEMALLQW